MDRMRRWQVGPFRLWVQRLRGEWLVATLELEDVPDDVLEVGREVPEADLDPGAKVERVGIAGEDTGVSILPLLPDRPVVTRPEKTFRLPSGETATLFVGSPLWLRAAPAGSRVSLLDAPLQRPSDTWFGPPTREGELCYASKTWWRLHLENIPPRQHRCVTAVTVRNLADTELVLDRLKLPVERLSLYVDTTGRLWTQDAEFVRRESDEHALIQVTDDSPRHANSPVRVSDARKKSEENLVMRAFSTLFSR